MTAEAMNLDQFRASLGAASPPKNLDPLLVALWWDAKGDFDQAHEIAQQDENAPRSAWVHAYLHRKGGDTSNAAYWYRIARQPVPDCSSSEEWQHIATAFLNQS